MPVTVSVDEHLQRSYPFLFDSEDERWTSPDDMEWAMGVAADFRPACLSANLQNLAQAHYTAYLLSAKLVAPQVYGETQKTQDVGVAGAVVERQEGNVRVRYSESGRVGIAVATRSSGGGDVGPAAPYAAWARLAAICGPVPGIDPTGTETEVQKVGGIMVRSNPRIVW